MTVFNHVDVKNYIHLRHWNKDSIGIMDSRGRMIELDTTGDGKVVRAINPRITGIAVIDSAIIGTVVIESAVIDSATINNLIATINNLIIKKVLSTDEATQYVTSDGDTLLDVSETSNLRVTVSTTGGPATNFTVGITAGSYPGHRVILLADPTYSMDGFELDDSVMGSATINGANISVQEKAIELVWNDALSTWFRME